MKTDKGIKLNQVMNLTAAGAAGGSFWDLLIGVIFLNPLLGAAAGAAGGALGGYLTDIGVDDKLMKSLAEDLETGEAVLFVQFDHATGDKVLAHLEGIGGLILQTSLSNDAEEKLRQTLAAGAPESA